MLPVVKGLKTGTIVTEFKCISLLFSPYHYLLFNYLFSPHFIMPLFPSTRVYVYPFVRFQYKFFTTLHGAIRIDRVIQR